MNQLYKELEELVKSKTNSYSRQEWISTVNNFGGSLYDYRFDHVYHVVKISKIIGDSEDANLDILTPAAWLHDIAKPGIGGISNHGEMSAEMATEILLTKGVKSDLVEKIADVIRKHVGLTLAKELTPIEAQILWEADKIDKLGIVGFIHFNINGVRIKPGMTIDEMANAIREFLPLANQIASSMHTRLGISIAGERYNHLVSISGFLDSEIRGHHGGNLDG